MELNSKEKSVELVDIPDGKYYATWCGYTVKIDLPDWLDKPIKVNSGIRGVSKVVVQVVNKQLFIL